MSPRDQDALNRRLQREADNARSAQNARNEQARRNQEADNRRRNEEARQKFNEGQDRNRRANEERNRKEQEKQRAHDKYMDDLRGQAQQQPWSSGGAPSGYPSSRSDDGHRPVGSGKSTGKKGSGFGKALLLMLGLIMVIGYFGSHSDRDASRTQPAQYVAPQEAAPTTQPTQPAESSPPDTPSQQYTPPTASPAQAPVDSTPPPQSVPDTQAPQTPPDDIPASPTAPPVTQPVLQPISRVQPVYPDIAKQMRMQGTVLVVLEVAPDGSVTNARAEHGNPIVLSMAAVDAAKRWRYAPYAPIPGQATLRTTVQFNFKLE